MKAKIQSKNRPVTKHFHGAGSRRQQRRQRRCFLGFCLPSLLGVSILVLLPSADVVRRSFTTAVTGQFVGMENYQKVFTNEAFRLAAKNTLAFTAVCLPLLIGMGLLVALLLSGLKQVQLFKSVFLFPMAMPAATVALVWQMVFSENGFLNLALNMVAGWKAAGTGMAAGAGVHVDFMGTDLSFWVLVFSYIWKNLGYTVVLWLSGILGIPGDIIEAARVDGAGKFRIWRSIMMPQLKGVLYTITVLSFLNSFKVFREAYLVAGPYPQEGMYLLQHLFNNWFTYLELDKMSAAAVCIAAVLLVFILLLQKLWDEGGEQV